MNPVSTPGEPPSLSFKAAAWFVACVAAIELLAGALLPAGFMTQTLHSRLREINQRPAPVVEVMGDSVSAAIRASVLAEAVDDPKWTVANYSLPGTTPIFPPFALERQCGAGRSPRVILYAPHPALLNAPKIERFVARFGTASEIAQLRGAGAAWTEIVYGALCKSSYTLRYREDLAVALTQGDLGFFQTWGKPVTSVAGSEQPLAEAPPEPDLRVTKYTAANLPPQLRQPFAVDPLNRACIHRLCEVAARENIQVLWVSMPTIGANTQDSAERAAFNAFLDEMSARHANFSVLHREIEAWPDGCFMDPRHLNPYGAWKFSRQLGGELAAWMKTNAALARGLPAGLSRAR